MGERKRLTRAQRGAYLRRPGAGRAVPRVAGRSQVASVCDRVTSLGAAFHVQSGDGTRAERDDDVEASGDARGLAARAHTNSQLAYSLVSPPVLRGPVVWYPSPCVMVARPTPPARHLGSRQATTAFPFAPGVTFLTATTHKWL